MSAPLRVRRGRNPLNLIRLIPAKGGTKNGFIFVASAYCAGAFFLECDAKQKPSRASGRIATPTGVRFIGQLALLRFY